MFVDASAIVAILLREPKFETRADRLRTYERPLTNGIAVYEAVLAIARDRPSMNDAEASVWSFVSLAAIEIVPITNDVTKAALSAFARYGKGRGHPARLNLGDCFAYASARTHGVPLLFVGNDFVHTDIPSATP